MNKPQCVYVTYIASTPEKVWEGLTSPEFTKEYWGSRSILSDWKVGSPVKLVEEGGGLDWHGEVLQYDPPKLLSYTFSFTPPGESGEPPSRVVHVLEVVGGVVRLTTTHDNLEPEGKTIRGISQGWPKVLSSLKTLLETGKGIDLNLMD
nr:hypothetical protein [uncultured bacterium]